MRPRKWTTSHRSFTITPGGANRVSNRWSAWRCASAATRDPLGRGVPTITGPARFTTESGKAIRPASPTRA